MCPGEIHLEKFIKLWKQVSFKTNHVRKHSRETANYGKNWGFGICLTHPHPPEKEAETLLPVVLYHPPPPTQLMDWVVGIWPKGSRATDKPVTYDMSETEKISRAYQILTLGIWFRKLQELRQLGKGQKRQECRAGDRVEVTKAKSICKPRLWGSRNYE